MRSKKNVPTHSYKSLSRNKKKKDEIPTFISEEIRRQEGLFFYFVWRTLRKFVNFCYSVRVLYLVYGLRKIVRKHVCSTIFQLDWLLFTVFFLRFYNIFKFCHKFYGKLAKLTYMVRKNVWIMLLFGEIYYVSEGFSISIAPNLVYVTVHTAV